MSKVLAAFNIAKINKQEKDNIVFNLYGHEFEDAPSREDNSVWANFLRSVKMENFGKLQYIYSNYSTEKSRLIIDGDLLYLRSGLIENDKKLCQDYKTRDIDRLIVNLYQKKTSELKSLLTKINGHYALFFYNKASDEISIINDRLGLYPAFIYENNKSFIYSSDPRAILQIDNLERKVNLQAVGEALLVGAVLDKATFFQDIRNLPVAVIFNKKIASLGKSEVYYEWEYGDPDYNREKYFDKVNDVLTTSILDLLEKTPEKTLVSLTGGFDTRLINSILVENKRDYLCFLLKYPDGEYKTELDKLSIQYDLDIGGRFARKYKLNYFIEGKESSREVLERPNRLSGFMGGELFGGDMYKFPRQDLHNILKDYRSRELLDNTFLAKLDQHPIDKYFRGIDSIKANEKDKQIYAYKRDIALTTSFDFIQDIGGPWHTPAYFFADVCHTHYYPYLNNDFLELLFKIPFTEISNHAFYREFMAKLYPEYCEFGFFHTGIHIYAYDKNKNPQIYKVKKLDRNVLANKSIVKKRQEDPQAIMTKLEETIGMKIFAKKEKLDNIIIERAKRINAWIKSVHV